MASLHAIAGYQQVSETPNFPESEIDANLILYGEPTDAFITEAQYLLDPQAVNSEYLQYSLLPNPSVSFEDVSVMYDVGETLYIPLRHPSFGTYDAPGTSGTLLRYVNDWNYYEPNPLPTDVRKDVQESIRQGTIGAIIAPDPLNPLNTYELGDIIGIDIASVYLEIKFQVNYFAPMIPRSTYESVPIVREDLLYSFTATGKVRDGVGMVLSWGSNDFETPLEARAVVVDRDTGQRTIGPAFSIYESIDVFGYGHGYYQRPMALTDQVSIIAVPYNANMNATWYAVRTDESLNISIVATGRLGGNTSVETRAICDPVIGRGLVIWDVDGSGNDINTWITSNIDGTEFSTSTTALNTLPTDTDDFLLAGYVVFNVDATNSLVVGASGRVLAIDWTARTVTYVRNILPNWTWDSTQGTICKSISPNKVDILYRSGSTYKLLAGVNIDGTGYDGDYAIPPLYYVNWNDLLSFDLEALLPLETGGWLIMQPIKTVSGTPTIDQKATVSVFINSLGSFVEARSIMRDTPVTSATSYSDQFQSSWADLGNGMVIGSLASRINQAYLLGTEFLTDTRSDDLLYINAPEVPDPVYPDGPLWYVSEPGYVEKWIPAFIYDGTTWQPCRMWDGTEFMESTIPLP
jgi:hypothetical protein